MTPINCKHWADIGARHSGRCALGLYGGHPSEGVCGRCEARVPRAATQRAVAPASKHLSPGGLLSAILSKLGHAKGGCGCDAYARQMNSWGWWGCWRRRKEIVAHLVGEAGKRGIEVDAATVGGLLRSEIRRRV